MSPTETDSIALLEKALEEPKQRLAEAIAAEEKLFLRACPVPNCPHRTNEFMCVTHWKSVGPKTRREFNQERARLVKLGWKRGLSPYARELIARALLDAIAFDKSAPSEAPQS